jgi:uncharacterized protein (DUF58 family)
MKPQDVIKKIQTIQIHTELLAKDLLSGAWHSCFKGEGIEFEEVREYAQGDDFRTIDWNVTARMGNPYVKRFAEERELSVMLAVDISASTSFGSVGISKKDLALEVAATIAFTAIHNHDKVGLALFSDEVEHFLAPKKGNRHVLRVIRDLLAWEPKNRGTNFHSALSFLGGAFQKRGILFFLSDFMGELPEKSFSVMSLKHDLIFICIQDPGEVQLADLGITTLQDVETGRVATVDTKKMKESYKIQREKNLAATKSLADRIGAGFVLLECGKPYLEPLRKYFKKRTIKR